MNGPSGSAVFDTTRIIIKSLYEANKALREAILNQESASSRQRFLDNANHNISALESTLEVVRDEVKAKITIAKRRRNALLPISRIPKELLANILCIALDISPFPRFKPEHVRQLQNLASVCSAWLDLVRSTPTLWSVLESNSSLDLLHTVIRKSKSGPLHIIADWRPLGARDSSEQAVEKLYRFFQIAAGDSTLTDR
ncbi:hypothetical protein FRB90_001829 [Tulasnella sp. 427]|nr:hypothetical protein FRB90_001829 [Tulasnella sp. 427]